jgi:hypothetical protein
VFRSPKVFNGSLGMMVKRRVKVDNGRITIEECRRRGDNGDG